ncbi:MAG TPA: HD domain-containing protein [Candidatus Saccharimonadia bacterium]
MQIEQLISYCRLLTQFQQVERQMLVPSGERNENDVEHSYLLAMTGWYIATTAKLDLQHDKVIKYALVHDLVEVYAGDTYFHDPIRTADKVTREEAAFEALRQNYPDFKELHALIKRYEKQTDAESRFIYALDKLLPVVTIYLDGGRSWHRDKISLELLEFYKSEKVAASAIIADLWSQLAAKLVRQPKLFPPGTKV